MRLRSSQFVFLLLLACSVQARESPAVRLASAAAAHCSSVCTESRGLPADDHAFNPDGSLSSGPRAVLPPTATAAAAYRLVWAIRPPARDSAAVSDFSSFRRG